ncbi:hypothetical protein PPL_08648 [Heterostelium album PN500]|uniref:Pesticidal crystal protein domain-containing protein n=1 Tax=Heterostelium pallidum (strain ATCC 26659 / Pp 5 / PN500) TaxID=670386 RepID=D3BJC3_HETP5|nr:hypothetical protein PPL_08648 [Heterostelium album PN500]EFA78003.1 hypothetical protein PPL_08648 [Heterostelium album PN500]|eukprot:XP_020430131.1 hypothetical protein PPL_08648 [Heterostelium album PN500]
MSQFEGLNRLDTFLKTTKNWERYEIGQAILKDLTKNDYLQSTRVIMDFIQAGKPAQSEFPSTSEWMMDYAGLSMTTASCFFYALSGSLAFPVTAGALCVLWAVITLAKKYIDASGLPTPGQDMTPDHEKAFQTALRSIIGTEIQTYDSDLLIAFYQSAQKRLKDLSIALQILVQSNYTDAQVKSRIPDLYRTAENALFDVMTQCAKESTDIGSLPMYAYANTIRMFLIRDALLFGEKQWGMSPVILRKNDLEQNMASSLNQGLAHVRAVYAKAEARCIANDGRNDVNTFNKLMQLRNHMVKYVFQFANLWEYIAAEPYNTFIYPQRSHLLMSKVVGCPVKPGTSESILTAKNYYRADLEQLKQFVANDRTLYWRGQPHGFYGQTDILGHSISWLQNSYHEPTLLTPPDIRSAGLDDKAYVSNRYGVSTDTQSTYQDGIYFDGFQVEYDLIPRDITVFKGKGIHTFQQNWTHGGNNLTDGSPEWSWHLRQDQYDFANITTVNKYIVPKDLTVEQVGKLANIQSIPNVKEVFAFEHYKLHSLFSFGVNQHYQSIDSLAATFMPIDAFGVNYAINPVPNEVHATLIDAVRAQTFSSTTPPLIVPDGIMPGVPYVQINAGNTLSYEIHFKGENNVWKDFKLNLISMEEPTSAQIKINIEGYDLETMTTQPNKRITEGREIFRMQGVSYTVINIQLLSGSIKLRSLMLVPQK